jgi:hypothetical protein
MEDMLDWVIDHSFASRRTSARERKGSSVRAGLVSALARKARRLQGTVRRSVFCDTQCPNERMAFRPVGTLLGGRWDAEESHLMGYADDLAVLEHRAIALAEAVDAVLLVSVPDPTAIRACGRVLGISRTLAWKLIRLAGAVDVASVLSALPGGRGWGTIMTGLERVGCDPRLLDDLRNEIDRFDAEITARGLDRERLAAMAGGGLDSEAVRRSQSRWREQATHATSRIWGVLAEVRIASYLVVPSGTDDLLDLASVSSIRGLHRLGPGPNPRLQMTTGAFRGATDGRIAPLASADWFDAAHSTPGVEDELRVHAFDSGCHVHFEGSGTSAVQPVDIVFREHLREAAYEYARHPREIGTFGAAVLLPSRWFVLEVLVDRSIAWDPLPEAATFSQLTGMPPRYRWSDVQRLPMFETVESGLDVDLPEELEAVRRPHHEVLVDAAGGLGRTLADFSTHMVVVPWPVLSSNVMIRWRLPERRREPLA